MNYCLKVKKWLYFLSVNRTENWVVAELGPTSNVQIMHHNKVSSFNYF